MAEAVVDTSVLLGRVDSADPRHDVASDIVRGMDHGELPTGRVTDSVVLETLNWIHSRHRHRTAVDVYDRLQRSSGFEVSQTAQSDFHRAIDLFEIVDSLAFGDATIVAYMQRSGLEYLYSFDDNFDGIESITRLETASNPFETG